MTFFPDRRDIIITSQMAISQISLTVAVNENVGTSLFFYNGVKK